MQFKISPHLLPFDFEYTFCRSILNVYAPAQINAFDNSIFSTYNLHVALNQLSAPPTSTPILNHSPTPPQSTISTKFIPN